MRKVTTSLKEYSSVFQQGFLKTEERIKEDGGNSGVEQGIVTYIYFKDHMQY